MHYGYIGKWGHVLCCWLGEAWLEIPVPFYKLLGFVHMEQCQEPKLCLKYLINTSQPVSSLFGHEVMLVILEQILQHTTLAASMGAFPALCHHSHLSPPLQQHYCECISREGHLPVSSALLLMIRIKLPCWKSAVMNSNYWAESAVVMCSTCLKIGERSSSLISYIKWQSFDVAHLTQWCCTELLVP